MTLFDIEKLSIKSAIESGDQTEYEYVGDSDSDVVIKRTFSRTGFHVFYIPVSKNIFLTDFTIFGI